MTLPEQIEAFARAYWPHALIIGVGVASIIVGLLFLGERLHRPLPDDFLDNGEQILFRGRPHWISNFEAYVGLVLGFWLIIPIIIAAYCNVRRNTTTYTLTTQRLRIEWGVLFRQLHELELYRVKDTSIQAGLLDRAFGVCDIHIISTDRSTPRLKLPCILDGRRVRELIRKHTEIQRKLHRVREVDMSDA
jgi:membrane protein YdbS with pleckstrin-like domain